MNAYSKHADVELRRSKSLCSLGAVALKAGAFSKRGRSRTSSDSSVEVFVVNDSDSDSEEEKGTSVVYEGELASLELKIDRLSDLFMEQCRLLSSIKDEIQDSRDSLKKSSFVQNQLLTEIVNNTITQRVNEMLSSAEESEREGNTRARTLLSALEVKRATLDHDVRDALTAFLQSDELRSRVVSATAASVREVVSGCVSRDVAAVYLPVLERAHRRLLRHVSRTLEEAFAEMGENSSQLSKQMFRASRNLRRTLERHSNTEAPNATYAASLRRTVEELLDKELKQWRQRLLEVLTAELQPESRAQSPAPLEYPEFKTEEPASPPQPADPEVSIIDQLMKTAEINKQISDGDVNEAFSRALSAADLALVTAACRAADPAALFAPPCALAQPVLLALAQQLATDMVHDTQLKCRYLEDAIISLDKTNPATRFHLPTVVGEVKKHLMKFLVSYPNHVASRRVTLIIMAADDLLKQFN